MHHFVVALFVWCLNSPASDLVSSWSRLDRELTSEGGKLVETPTVPLLRALLANNRTFSELVAKGNAELFAEMSAQEQYLGVRSSVCLIRRVHLQDLYVPVGVILPVLDGKCPANVDINRAPGAVRLGVIGILTRLTPNRDEAVS